MKILESIQDRLSGLLIGGDTIKLRLEQSDRMVEAVMLRAEEAEIKAEDAKVAKESIADLELALEDTGWREMSTGGDWNLTRNGLRKMIALARLMYLANPLIRRAVTVQELYVWANGCTIKADTPIVNEVLEDFFKAPKNQSVIGDSWPEREREQRNDGNTFFILFTNRETGAVRVRLLPVDQVENIIFNPEDSKEPWFYKRFSHAGLSPEVNDVKTIPSCYYPDIDYNPRIKLYAIGGIQVRWDSPVLHVKTGGLSQMVFGLPELFAALNWATAYKKILENFATVLAAYARVAMKLSNARKKDIPASKSKLQTGVVAQTQAVDNNPPTNTGSIFLASGGMDLTAVKTAHSTTGPDEARALRSMVAAGTDTPEHFFGDSDIGNFATSTTLDRPTELKMVGRQNMWGTVIVRLATYVINKSASASNGKLRNAGFRSIIEYDPFDKCINVVTTAPDGSTTKFSVSFPSILERDVVDRVRAVVQAITLGGGTAEGIIPDRKFAFEMLLVALGEKRVDELVAKYYPNSVIQGFKDPAKVLDNDTLKAEGSKELGDAAMIAAKAKKAAGDGPNTSASAD